MSSQYPPPPPPPGPPPPGPPPPGPPPPGGSEDPYGDQPGGYGDQPGGYGDQPGGYGDRPGAYADQPGGYAGQPPYQGPPTRQGDFQPYPGGPEPHHTDAKGFFGALFDFSFRSFVTPKIVKFVYVLATVLLGLTYVVWVIVGFASDSPALGIAVLVLGWIPILLYLALIRMTLEFYYAIVRMSQDINQRLPG